MSFRLPNAKQRCTIIGRTGSGKTQFGAWLLSEAPFDVMPYIIVDYKGDDLLNSSDRIKEIRVGEVPKQAGLYVAHPHPAMNDAVEQWLWKIWERERVGLYFDEAYVLPEKGALQAVLTQGRSKRIPAILLTQRPTAVSRFVFTEADFFSVFNLNDERDYQTLAGFTPFGKRPEKLPDYHSRWFDVGKNFSAQLKPVPNSDAILDRIDNRLAPKRWYK